MQKTLGRLVFPRLQPITPLRMLSQNLSRRDFEFLTDACRLQRNAVLWTCSSILQPTEWCTRVSTHVPTDATTCYCTGVCVLRYSVFCLTWRRLSWNRKGNASVRILVSCAELVKTVCVTLIMVGFEYARSLQAGRIEQQILTFFFTPNDKKLISKINCKLNITT